MVKVELKKGFTLLEIVLVMVLISILVVGAVVGYSTYIDMSRESTAKADFQRTFFDLIRMNNLGQGPEFIVKEKMIPELVNLGYHTTLVASADVENYSGTGVPGEGLPLPGEVRVNVENVDIIEARSGYKTYNIVMGRHYILIRAAHTRNGLGVRYQFNHAGTDIVYTMGVINVAPESWLFLKAD